MSKINVVDEKLWNLTIHGLPEEVARHFKAWCKLHANNKFNYGLARLLEIAEQEDKINLIAGHVNDLLVWRAEIERQPDVEGDEGGVETFGGNVLK